ncbi:MAG: phenylalanine--tRNA ligase subunit beta [Ruminococcaceae bacterium]|nr:phenylalanine--tRNA ligase subunit beta [Oscillospiraceae bacterium]
MKISLNWLKRYVDIDVPVDVLCDKMVMSGFEVESIEDLSETMRNVVAARIVKLEKHPDADKLQICRMDIGGEELVQIVTGADNVFEGAIVPAALHDSDLPNGMHIKKGKLRGVPSDGMLCSGEELCLKESDYPGAEVYGILILKDDIAPGTDMRDVLRLNDVVIDFKITANRPDCNSVLGVAREIAVALEKPFYQPEISYTVKGGDIRDHIDIEVTDYDLCPRYLGRVVKNLRIAPSPDWMKDCLKTAGVRPINNIVDITNYVMLETGQPMHAFDLRDIKGSRILVRRATDGEQMTTLDGKDHTLTSEMLVIADAQAPSCLAGIMGGLNSEIKDDTTDLFLECAKFRRDSVRRTARALGMRTESSARFEKGVDIHTVAYAMDRALQLIDELDAGDIIDGSIDRYEELPDARVLTVRADSISELLGVDVPHEAMVKILNNLCVETTLDNGVLTCKVPSFRDDIEGRADLAEEVMRIYGYDHIVGTPMRGSVTRGKKLPERVKSDKIKTLLCANGVQEITTYSFIASKAIDILGLAENDPRRQAVVIKNPLGDEYSTMRTQLITSMLSVMATNYNRKASAVRLFEVSKLFVPKALPLTEQPLELPALSIGLYGEGESFFTLKGLLEQLFAAFELTVSYTRSDEPYLHPGRQAKVLCGETVIATFGELHPDCADTIGIGTKAYVAQVELKTLFENETSLVLYKPLPRFPAVERDLALLCDASLPAADIETAIRAGGGKLLEDVRLFDVYQGAQIEAGKKSVAYSLWFRSNEGTLSDADIEPALRKIFKKLEEIGCSLRS